MNTRLTNAIREEIIKKGLEKSGFPARLKKAKEDREDLKVQLLISALGGAKKYAALEERFNTIAEKVEKLIKEGFSVTLDTYRYNAYINIAGQTIKYPNMNKVSEKYKNKRLIYLYGSAPIVTADNPLVQKFWDAENKVKDLESSLDSIRDNIHAVVYSVNTTKRLVEVWPESAELIPTGTVAIKAGLPAINFTSLNAAIGIPTPEVKKS